jgi:ABC-type cobalt transport system substrate-binding protein
MEMRPLGNQLPWPDVFNVTILDLGGETYAYRVVTWFSESKAVAIAVQHHHAHVAACLAEHGERAGRDRAASGSAEEDGLHQQRLDALWNDRSGLVDAAWFTFKEALGGFAVGCSAGIAVALVLARWRPLASAVMPYAIAANAIRGTTPSVYSKQPMPWVSTWRDCVRSTSSLAGRWPDSEARPSRWAPIPAGRKG